MRNAAIIPGHETFFSDQKDGAGLQRCGRLLEEESHRDTTSLLKYCLSNTTSSVVNTVTSSANVNITRNRDELVEGLAGCGHGIENYIICLDYSVASGGTRFLANNSPET